MSEKNLAEKATKTVAIETIDDVVTTNITIQDGSASRGILPILIDEAALPLTQRLQDSTSLLAIDKLVKLNQFSTEQLVDLLNSAKYDNMFPLEQLSGTELNDKVNQLREWVETERGQLDSTPFSMDVYNKKKAVLQSRAAFLLILECFIGQQLLKIERRNGTNKKSKSRAIEKKKTKTEIIQENYHLSPRLARDFQDLTWDGVKAAIELALLRGDIPTRALALSKSAKIKADQNKTSRHIKHTKFELNSVEETEYKKWESETPLYITSLFSNISLGLSRIDELNIHCAVAAECDPLRAKWHQLLFPDCHMVQGDFTSEKCFNETLEWHKKKGCNIVMASPCCEPFSNLNNSPNKDNVEEAKHFYYTAEFIKKARPKAFIIENVPGFVDARPKIAHDILTIQIDDVDENGNVKLDENGNVIKKDYVRCIGEYLSDELGPEFHTNFGIHTAADYGCVEDRLRLTIIGIRKDISDELWKFPKRHAVRKMLWQVIGHLKSLDNGEVDANDPWHYARELPECVIHYLEKTPTGCSAWENAADRQPVTEKGEYMECKFGRGITRNNWQDLCPTITTGNGSLTDLYSIHPGRYNPDKDVYTDCRVFSLRELLAIMNCPTDFFDRLNLKREANGMLNETEENALRKAIGQHFCPDHVNALYSTLSLSILSNPKVE